MIKDHYLLMCYQCNREEIIMNINSYEFAMKKIKLVTVAVKLQY